MSDSLQMFLEIGVVSTFLSFFVQFIKEQYGTQSDTTRAITLGASIVLGTGYYFLFDSPLWLPIVAILGTATTFHAFFLKR